MKNICLIVLNLCHIFPHPQVIHFMRYNFGLELFIVIPVKNPTDGSLTCFKICYGGMH